MSIHINSNKTIELKDLKINGKYINKIYYCDLNLFKNVLNNCVLIYKVDKEYIKYKINLKFSCYDLITGESLLVDSINIYDKKLSLDQYSIYKISDNISGYIVNYDEIFYKYNLVLNKVLYLPGVVLLLINNYSKNQINYIDLGKIPLMPLSRKDGYTIIWDLYPRDLDSHMFSFNSNFELQLHCFYSNKEGGNISDIKLDIDDTTSYGPETITINNCQANYYYLYTIHNFTYYTRSYYEDYEYTLLMDSWTDQLWSNFYEQLDNYNSNFNYNNETKIHIVHKGKIYTIQPPNTSNKNAYWYDVFVRYNNKIYIVNKIIDSSLRSAESNFYFSSENAKTMIENYIQTATQIILLE